MIDCSSKGLQELPNNIPSYVTELKLNNNKISRIPANSFSELTQLEKLDLASNEISVLENDAFSGLAGLQEL